MRTKKLISILLAAVMTLFLCACGKNNRRESGIVEDDEIYPEDMPFKITKLEDTNVSMDTVYTVDATLAVYGNNFEAYHNNYPQDNGIPEDYDAVKDFLDYYDRELSLEYDCDFFFFNPKNRKIVNNGKYRLPENITAYVPYKSRGDKLYDAPRFEQQFRIEENPYFENSQYMRLNITCYATDALDGCNGQPSFEFKMKKMLSGVMRAATLVFDIYMNGKFVAGGQADVSSDPNETITRYELANFLYSNYLILSPSGKSEGGAL